MMVVLVAGYPICVGGGTTFVDTYLPLASFPCLLVVKDKCCSEAENAFTGTNVKLSLSVKDN